jgi:DNA-binding CsgD family transcriptional regulator
MEVVKDKSAVDRAHSLDDFDEGKHIHQQGNFGFLVLAPPLQLLQLNQRALNILRKITELTLDDRKDKSSAARGLIPAVILEICFETFRHLQDRSAAKDWEQFEVRHIISVPEHPILVRGFGIPDSRGSQDRRIVIILEELGRQKDGSDQQTAERFQLTEREQDVVECLAKGWTNKEIACELGIALPTIKQHIRHIMEKTKSTTRTGILMQIFRK